MHDIDRTQRELEMAAEHEHEAEYEHEAEHEAEAEHEHEAFLGSLFGEAEQEAEHEHEGEHEHEAEHEYEAESPLSETQEMELASELLEVSSEAELEYFFGKLARSAVRGVKNFARSSAGKMVGRVLKGVAKKALPIAGKAVGAYFGGPLGAKIGGGLGKMASNLFELELEGLSHEDREFEVARQVVRLGAAAMNRAAQAPSSAPPALVARRAVTSAARVYAPGLLRRSSDCRKCGAPGTRGKRRRSGPGTTHVRQANGGTRINGGAGEAPGTADAAEPTPAGYGTRGGRWFRRGRNIVLTGL